MWKLLKKFVCKFTICCKSNCTLNDTNGDGIPDQIDINPQWIDNLNSDEDE